MVPSSPPPGAIVPVVAPLDAATQALVTLAATIARGDENRIAAAADRLAECDGVALWADELLLQSILMVGYPRALVGVAIWRERSGATPATTPDDDSWDLADWTARGEATCRVIYGRAYSQLRANVRALHPVMDAWMVTEGYGRTISRPGLDLARRELCTVAQCAVLAVPRQFHSHARGALHAGATPEAVGEAVTLGLLEGASETAAGLQNVWERIRARWAAENGTPLTTGEGAP